MKLNLTPDMILPCIYAFFASFGFSYVFNLRGKNMFYAALGGGLSWFVYLLFAGCFSSDVPQFFLSMVAVSLYSEYMARKHHSPVTVYLVIYFLMTRFFRMRRWYLDAFLAVGIFVCLFGITDYFQMDLLGFKEGMVPEQRGIYTSTLGNINTYTIYVGAVLTVSALLFMLETNWKRMLWYYGNMVLASFALIMGTSDNAYLSLAALFGLAPLYLFRTRTGVRYSERLSAGRKNFLSLPENRFRNHKHT